MSFPCVVCKTNVTKVLKPGLQCAGPCKKFYHFDKCSQIEPEEIDYIEKKRLQWRCNNCKGKRNSLVFARRASVQIDDETSPNNDKTSTIDKVDDKKSDLEIIIENQEEIQNTMKVLKDYLDKILQKVDLDFKVVTESIKTIANKVEYIQNKIEDEISSQLKTINNNMKQSNNLVSTDEVQSQSYSYSIEKSKPSYANALKNPVIIIKPKDKQQTSKSTADEIKEFINNPESYNVRGVKEFSEGKVIIACKDSESIEKFREEVVNKMGDNYEIDIPKTKMKQIKVWGLSEICSATDFIEKLTRCNDIIGLDSKISVVNMKESSRGVMVLLETDELTHKRLIEAERIYLDWDICRVYEYIHVTRCFKCQQFGHTSKYCKRNETCGICAGNHKTDNCTNEVTNCVNCMEAKERMKVDLDINHKAWDMFCPVYVHKVETERKKLCFRK